jgi:hypothetical protein
MYSYVHHGTRMTVSFMFCALVASYGVRMVVQSCQPLGSISPHLNTSLIHEYHVDIPWIGVRLRLFAWLLQRNISC